MGSGVRDASVKQRASLKSVTATFTARDLREVIV